MKQYVWNLLIAFDQLANALIGPALNRLLRTEAFGFPDETISSAMGKVQDRCSMCAWLCRLLHRFDPDHCNRSIERDEGRM